MSTPSEDNLIDQSLRDVFRDYDLPPESHPRVWEGVAERIATLPETSSGLPYRLLLPLTAVLGVGVGWLLPKPVAAPAPPAARVTQVLARPTTPTVPPAALAVAQSPESPAVVKAMAAPLARTARPVVAPAQRWLVTPSKPVPHAQRVAVPAAPPADSTSTIAVPTETATTSPGPAVPAAAAPVAAPVPVETAAVVPVASSQPPQAAPVQQPKAVKPSGTYEKVTYRKLSQRQPERGTGIRRWFSHLFQSVKHLLG